MIRDCSRFSDLLSVDLYAGKQRFVATLLTKNHPSIFLNETCFTCNTLKYIVPSQDCDLPEYITPDIFMALLKHF